MKGAPTVPETTDHEQAEQIGRLAVDGAELGQLLGLSVKTIRRLNVRHKLPRPITTLGRRVLYVLDGPRGIKRWLELGCPDRVTFEAMTST